MTTPLYLNAAQNTEEIIRQRMLDRIPADVDKSEGSYIWDSIAPVSIELVFVAMLAQYVLEMGFAQTAGGEYLTMRAAEHGVIRRAAIKSTGAVALTGTAGAIIPAGTKLATEGEESDAVVSIQFVTTGSATLNDSGNGTVAVEATEAGVAGNVPAGKIVVLMTSNANIKTVTNPEAIAGGLDEEDDETLRKRYLEKVRYPGTSGNIADYKHWAQEVSGVTDLHVIPLWDGPGTVKLIILGPNKLPPNQELIDNVRNYIAPTNGGERKAPIGATVTVTPAEAMPINVSATILLDTEAAVSLAEIRETFNQALSNYLAEMAFKAEMVRYARIGGILIEQPGVLDYVNLTINGNEDNIPILENQVAVAGTVTINV